MVYRLAVFGNPVAHSLSPQIHQCFAQQLGIEIDYQRIRAPIDGFEKCCRQFFDEGGLGCSITLPFKEKAYYFTAQHSKAADLAKAINFIKCVDGQLLGDNFDGQGLVNDLERNKSVELAGKKIIILGAGGASRGILMPLLQANPSQIIIVNRTLERAETLLKSLGNPGKVITASWDMLISLAPQCDVLIDATSSTEIIQQISSFNWSLSLFVYDLKYYTGEKSLVFWAKQQGFQNADGFGMLVEQAALAFNGWFGVTPDTGRLINNGCEFLINKS